VVVQRSRQRHEKCYMTFFGDSGVAAEIAVGGGGQIVMDFSTEGMFRGARDSVGRREVAIY
jgi:hypothetical protein